MRKAQGAGLKADLNAPRFSAGLVTLESVMPRR